MIKHVKNSPEYVCPVFALFLSYDLHTAFSICKTANVLHSCFQHFSTTWLYETNNGNNNAKLQLSGCAWPKKIFPQANPGKLPIWGLGGLEGHFYCKID